MSKLHNLTHGMRYVTDETGQRVAVVLELSEYERLIARHRDSELLLGLEYAELQALSHSKLIAAEQDRLALLLEKNGAEAMSDQERSELDALLDQIDRLNVLKGRALYTLRQLFPHEEL